MDEDIDRALKTLIRGTRSKNYAEFRQAYRRLYKMGARVIAVLEDRIFATPFRDIKYQEQLNTLGGLFNLLYDLNEEYASRVMDKVQNQGCTPLVESLIASVTVFSLHHYKREGFDELFTICVSKRLSQRGKILKKIHKWLHVIPVADLRGIERIYVVDRSGDGYAGTYTPILCNIMLKWGCWSFYNPISRVRLFWLRYTLYHEIGHHVHKHKGGTDPEQEDEADEYAADKIMRNSVLFGRLYEKATREDVN